MKKYILCVLIILVFGSFLSAASHKSLIYGVEVTYKSSSEVTVQPGSGRCNDNFFETTSAIDVNLSSVLPAGEDFLYIYIDDSASATTYPTPTITGSTTEPSFSSSQYGWYSGNDRCIGVVWCDSSGNIIDFQNNDRQEYIVMNADLKQVLTNGNPTGSNTTVETTAYIPVNAESVLVYADNSAASGSVTITVKTYENSGNSIKARGNAVRVFVEGWLPLQMDWSRDLVWVGENNDDNYFNVYIRGYRIRR